MHSKISQAKRHNITNVVYFTKLQVTWYSLPTVEKKELTLMGLMLLILIVNVTTCIIFQNQHAAYQQNNQFHVIYDLICYKEQNW